MIKLINPNYFIVTVANFRTRPEEKFVCKNADCIPKYEVCDGIKDCADGSDETEESCKNGSPSCHTFSYYCKYGACVGDRIQRPIKCDKIIDCVDGSDEENCDGDLFTTYESESGDVRKQNFSEPTCILPIHPKNGRFSSLKKVYTPGANVNNFALISLKCDIGYKSVHNSTLVCVNNAWIGGAFTGELCKKLCTPLEDPSYVATCKINQEEIECTEAVDGTTATTKCATYFRQDYGRPRMTCIDGRWSPYIGACYPECGKKQVNARTTIIGGEQAIQGEYPWIIAVYDKTNTQICGGSLISRKHVLSAAHCFTDSHGKPYDKNDYTIVAGKYHRLFDDNRDVGRTQIRRVHKLYVYDHYRGIDLYFTHDIIVVELSEAFQLSLTVQPVCIDWNNEHENTHFRDGKEGVIAGWGFTTDSGTPAESLKKLIIPYRNNDVCQQHLNADYYNRYFTYDKICAGYLANASNVCSGDSGSGYYFSSLDKFYVRGIASSVQLGNATICDQNNFALYTKVSTYLLWLEEVTGKYL